MTIEVLISKQGTLVSLSIEAAGLIVQELKTLTDQNREYNNSINSGIDMLKEKLVELSERQLNTYTNSNYILRSIDQQIDLLSVLVSKTEVSSTAIDNAAKALESIDNSSKTLVELEGKQCDNSNSIKEKQGSIESKAESIIV